MNFLFCLTIFFSFSTYAEIFSWTDATGKKHFSDKSHKNAQILKVIPGFSYYQVKKIYDGDTVLLENGKKVRFLGVNTPEVEGRNKIAQAGGEEAKQWLSNRLKNIKVRLQYDVEKKDKYNRYLAHLFTEDKEHINLELLKRGLASVNIYPPNLKYIDQFLLAQQDAKTNVRGIWSKKAYQPKSVEQVNKGNYKGWQRVIGQVKSIRHMRKYSYLNFSNTFALKISKQSLKLFPEIENYIERKIEVRGWINKNKGRFSMFIRHPSAIVFL